MACIYETSKVLANELLIRGKELRFEENSILNGIGNEIAVDYNKNEVIEIGKIEETKKNIEDTMIVIGKIATAMQNEVNLYKNHFKPILLTYIDNCKSVVHNSVQPDYLYNIIELELPKLLKDADSLNLFTKNVSAKVASNRNVYTLGYKGTNLVIKKENLKIPGGMAYLNDIITSEDLMEPKITKYIDILVSYGKTTGSLLDAEDLIKAWVIGNHILEDRLSDFMVSKDALLDCIWATEFYLRNAISEYESLIASERLIYRVIDKNIYVIKDVYDSIDGEIGIADALLGAGTTISSKGMNNSTATKSYIISNKAELIKLWNTYLAGAKYENPIRKNTRLKSMYQIEFNNLLNELADDMKYYNTYSGNVTNMLTDIREYLDGKNLSEEDANVEEICIHIVANILFNNTNYGKFLCIAERYLNNDTELTVDDVISYVITELVVDFLLSKTKVFTIK